MRHKYLPVTNKETYLRGETAVAPGASMTVLSPKLAFVFDEVLRLSLSFMLVAIVLAK